MESKKPTNKQILDAYGQSYKLMQEAKRINDFKINKNHFFFNYKGITGHVAFDKKPDKKTLAAFKKLIEAAEAYKITKPKIP